MKLPLLGSDGKENYRLAVIMQYAEKLAQRDLVYPPTKNIEIPTDVLDPIQTKSGLEEPISLAFDYDGEIEFWRNFSLQYRV